MVKQKMDGDTSSSEAVSRCSSRTETEEEKTRAYWYGTDEKGIRGRTHVRQQRGGASSSRM